MLNEAEVKPTIGPPIKKILCCSSQAIALSDDARQITQAALAEGRELNAEVMVKITNLQNEYVKQMTEWVALI